MSKEVTVILRDSERSYKQKFLVYDDIQIIPEDPIISNCIQQAKKNFEGEPEDIQIRILLVVR